MSSMMMKSGTFLLARERILHRGVLHVLVPLLEDVILVDFLRVHAGFILIRYLTILSRNNGERPDNRHNPTTSFDVQEHILFLRGLKPVIRHRCEDGNKWRGGFLGPSWGILQAFYTVLVAKQSQEQAAAIMI